MFWIYATGTFCLLSLSAAVTVVVWLPVWLMRRMTFAPEQVVFSVPTRERVVALTIDDGPCPESTPEILDELQRTGAHATFFPWAAVAEQMPEVMRRLVSEGHELGNHLLRDDHCWELPSEQFLDQLRDADRILRQFGGPIQWFRPPKALATSAQYREIGLYGYRPALASVYVYDTHLPIAWLIARLVLWKVKPGAIIVLHDGPRRGRRTVQVLRRILPELQRRGYRVVPLTTLASAAEKRLTA